MSRVLYHDICEHGDVQLIEHDDALLYLYVSSGGFSFDMPIAGKLVEVIMDHIIEKAAKDNMV